LWFREIGSFPATWLPPRPVTLAEFFMTTLHSRRGTTASSSPGKAALLGQVYLDVRRRLLYCLNDRARQLRLEGLPFLGADLEQQPLHTLSGELVTAADLPLIRAWREARPQEATFLLKREGSAVRHVSWSAAPLFNRDNQVIGVSGCILCAPPEPDWQALAGLAHDLRSPLQALRLLVTLVQGQPLGGDMGPILDRIRSAAERAQLIGRDLLEWCRGPLQGGRRVEQNWFALEPFLKDLAQEQWGEARHKSLELTTDLEAAQGLEIHSDRVRLGRMLANLLSNAVRYTRAGRVEFKASWRSDARGRSLVLGVVDTGSGISKEEQESIFHPFERGRAAKEGESSSGSGIGLAVVERLVEELKLSLEVYSEYGKGSAFHLIIPGPALRTRGAPVTPALPG